MCTLRVRAARQILKRHSRFLYFPKKKKKVLLVGKIMALRRSKLWIRERKWISNCKKIICSTLTLCYSNDNNNNIASSRKSWKILISFSVQITTYCVQVLCSVHVCHIRYLCILHTHIPYLVAMLRGTHTLEYDKYLLLDEWENDLSTIVVYSHFTQSVVMIQ